MQAEPSPPIFDAGAGHKNTDRSNQEPLKMLHFKLCVFPMLLGSAAAGEAMSLRRRLQHAAIVGFAPLTDVRDQVRREKSKHAVSLASPLFRSTSNHSFEFLQNRIDLDQQKIEELLAIKTSDSFAQAQKMYEEGSFSKTVADLTLTVGLPVAVPHGTKMVGVTTDDTTTATGRSASTVEVFAYGDYEAGATTLRVQYFNEGCYVGANPDPVTVACKSHLREEEDTSINDYHTVLFSNNVPALSLLQVLLHLEASSSKTATLYFRTNTMCLLTPATSTALSSSPTVASFPSKAMR